MAERAAHLVDHVLPAVPMRQWVLSLPFRLRYLLAWNHELCREVLAVYARALRGFYRRRARRAGITQAAAATATSTIDTARNVSASVGCTPKSSVVNAYPEINRHNVSLTAMTSVDTG